MFDIKKINSIQLDLSADKEYSFFIAKRDKIDFIYNTTTLEGCAFTYPEVETLLDGITIGGHKLSDEQMILNQNRAVELLFDLVKNDKFKLDKKIVCKLHTKVSFEEALKWGEFRDGNIKIGGTDYLPPNYKELDVVFKKGINQLQQINHPVIRAICYFLFGSKMQFFYDGNKRVSRLVTNGILLSNGYLPLNLKVKDKLEINKQMISLYENKDCTKSLEYFLNYYLEQNKFLRREV
jgi:Fic family protein